MAFVSKDSIAYDFIGEVDGLIFKRFGEKKVVYAKPDPPKFHSSLQKRFRDKFREASVYATICVRDPQRKADYKRKAKKLKVPNAYTAALTDYLRKSKIEKVDILKFKGRAGDKILITTTKKGFNLASVAIVLLGMDGEAIHSGSAVSKSGVHWEYRMPVVVKEYRQLEVTVKDHTGQCTSSIIRF